jgi:glycogen(starch) synthase
MKVLMFGWEFPPHISGGLGTACFGLTESLTKENTQILFVIPKTDNESIEEGLRIRSASNVEIPISSIVKHTIQHKHKCGDSEISQSESKLEVIRVTAELTPYTSPHVLSDIASISNWNYQFSESSIVPSFDLNTNKAKEQATIRYQFSGGYEPNLLEEVERYGLAGAEIARQETFDIIHAHDWLTYKAGIAAKEISGKPLVIHVHATEFDRAGKNVDGQIFRMEREGMEAADRIITVSEWTKNIIIANYFIPASKITVVHNGALPANQIESIQRPPIGKPIITFLGRITFQKGPEYFVEAAAKVLLKFPNVHFVMAGSGDLLPAMIERVARLRIASHFHFTGFLKGEKVDQLWSVTTMYAMPSVSEPFGISPLEAVQAGVPVIISNQSGVAEVMNHVVKVDYWNVEALADAMCNILKYQSLSKMLISKSKNEISNVTWERAANKINTLYYELTTEK